MYLYIMYFQCMSIISNGIIYLKMKMEEKDLYLIIEKFRFKPVSSGPNVTLLILYDEGVYYGEKRYDGVPVVSPVQIYLDLINNKGRGEEPAQFLKNLTI